MRCGFFASLLAAVLVLFAGVPGVMAHSQLVSSTPADGAVVAAMPDTVKLTFNEDIAEFPQAVLADAQNVVRKVTPTVSGATLTVPVPADQPTGRVEVRYRVVSADGHPIAGTIVFTVKGASSSSAATSATAGASASPSSAAPTATHAARSAADAEDPSTGWMYILMGLAVALVIGVGLLIRFMGRRRPTTPHQL